MISCLPRDISYNRRQRVGSTDPTDSAESAGTDRQEGFLVGHKSIVHNFLEFYLHIFLLLLFNFL